MIHAPKNTFSISELFAFLSVDDDGCEGLLAANLGPNGTVFPLIGADRERVESYRPYAAEAALKTGKKIRLARFSTKTILEEFDGGH